MKLVHNVSRETGEGDIHPPRGGVLRRSRFGTVTHESEAHNCV